VCRHSRPAGMSNSSLTTSQTGCGHGWPPRRAWRSCPRGTVTPAIPPPLCSKHCWPHPLARRLNLFGDNRIAAPADWLQDDVTLLAAQRRTPTPPLHMAVDATIHAARAVRAGFVKWLLEIGADSADVSDVVHAISEFVENAGRRGVARRRWNLHADYCRADASPVPTGELRHRRAGQSGDLPTGHRLRVRFPCRRCWSHHRQRRPRFTHRIHLGPSDRCRKPFRHGAFDDDLSRVTHLGSAGVGALAAACDRARRQGGDCVLVAPPGSPAHQVKNVFGEE
jgi:hypothetical protein